MWAYHCPTRSLPPLSLALSPFVCLALRLAHAYLIRWAHHFLKGLGTSSNSSFFGGSDCFMTHLPQLVAIDCVARVAPQGLPQVPHTLKSVNHICHMRDFQHVIWRSPSQLHFTFQIRKRIRNEIENRIQFPKSSVCNQCGQLDCWSWHTPCAINA